ncbi:MAG: radical SAM protein [Proteobacteria bacterium]|nr:radical SAM protein [Pseudomonadota bacterium]
MRERLSLNISVARSCFVKCLGCYNHFGNTPNLISTQNILLFLAVAKKRNFTKVTLCGGDPLSRPNIIDLLDKVKSLGFYISLDTVGTPLLGEAKTIFYGSAIINKIDAADIAKYVDLVGIPLDGTSDEVTSLFRTARPNHFAEQTLILKMLSAAEAKICINTVVHKGNIDHIEKMLPILSDLEGIKRWQLFQFMPIGPLGYKNRETYEVSDEKFFLLKEKITNQKELFLKNTDVEFKAKAERKGNYMFVDSEGLAWVPNIAMNEEWDKQKDTTHKRLIIGNINIPDDHEKILERALNPHSIQIE